MCRSLLFGCEVTWRGFFRAAKIQVFLSVFEARAPVQCETSAEIWLNKLPGEKTDTWIKDSVSSYAVPGTLSHAWPQLRGSPDVPPS